MGKKLEYERRKEKERKEGRKDEKGKERERNPEPRDCAIGSPERREAKSERLEA